MANDLAFTAAYAPDELWVRANLREEAVHEQAAHEAVAPPAAISVTEEPVHAAGDLLLA